MEHHYSHPIQSTLPSPSSLKRPFPLNTRTLWAVLAGTAVCWAIWQGGLWGRDLINPGGWTLTWRFIQASAHPIHTPEFLRLTWYASLTTLAYAVCGTFLSLILGLVGGILSSEIWWQTVVPPNVSKVPWFGVRAVLAVPRSIHEILWGLFFINILGLDPLVAILAIALPFGAITAKVFAEILDETPRAPFDALRHSGVSPLVAFFYGLLPPALPNLLSYAFYRFECSLRSVAVLGTIGAGGLGYEVLLSSQALRYQEMWTFLYALILLSGLTDLISGLVRTRLGTTTNETASALDTAHCTPVTQPQKRDRLVTWLLVVAVIAVPLAFWYVHADFSHLLAPRVSILLADVAAQSFPPTLAGGSFSELFTQTLQTLALSILAMAIASSGAVWLSFLAARNLVVPAQGKRSRRFVGNGIWFLARITLLVCRAIPASIWALILLFVLFPGILPGALALGVYTLGVLGRLMAEVVEGLDERPSQAISALGAPPPQAFLYGTMPRVIPQFTGYILYRWEVCARETAIVGVVGAGGLGRLLAEQMSNFNYAAVFTILLCFMLLTVLVDMLSAITRRMLR